MQEELTQSSFPSYKDSDLLPGYDFFGPLEESGLEEIKQQFETNVFDVM